MRGDYGPKVLDSQLTPGVEVYYTGDMANSEARGRCMGVRRSERFTDQYQLELETFDGEMRTTHVPLACFQPGPGRRFWLAADWDERRRKRIKQKQTEMRRAQAT